MGNEQSTPTANEAVFLGVGRSSIDLTREEKAAKFAEELERKRLENFARKKAEREAGEEVLRAELETAEKEARAVAERQEAESVRLEKGNAASTDGSELTAEKSVTMIDTKAALKAKMEAVQRDLVEQRRRSVGRGPATCAAPAGAIPAAGSPSDQNRPDRQTSRGHKLSGDVAAGQSLSKVVPNANGEQRGRTGNASSPPGPTPKLPPRAPLPVHPCRGRNDNISRRRGPDDSGIGTPGPENDNSRASKIPIGPSRRGSSENERVPTGRMRRPSSNKEREMTPPRNPNNTNPDSVKRPAPPRDEEPPKRPRPSSSSSASVRSPREMAETLDREPPAWYSALSIVPKRAGPDAAVEPLLKGLKTKVTLCKDPRNTLAQQQTYNEIRRRIHELMFQIVNEKLLRNNSMLHSDRGLPQLFDERYSGGVDWPFDIKADAKELYFKWCNRVFDTDLLRGIIPGGGKSNSSDRSSDKLDPKWPYRVSPEFYGNGQLVNGQWWPTQLAALRDGGHGSSQAGIYGRADGGAYSCIMAGNPDYEDKDEGEVVYYCGTDSFDGKITAGTNNMMVSSIDGSPVRLIRSHKVQSKYAPEMGLRYDGLYDVVSYERLDPEVSLRQRHRFKLVRRPGQDPIRGGNGPEKRPTQQEIEAHQKDKRLRGVGGGAIKGKKGTVFPTW